MKLYNTLTKRLEVFKPIKAKEIGMYVCGPTVQGVPHIGHARTYIAFDVIRKFLEFEGYKVKYIMNITDVHDDIIKEANKLGIDINKLADKNTKIFFKDLDNLGIKKATVYPRVTKHIKEIIEIISTLIKKGYAYETKGEVYFDVSKFKNYGKLSGIKLKEEKTGTRVETDKYEKKDVSDFALWKSKKKEKSFWKSPWGEGRPGWHIECSAMSMKYLNKEFDIHGGAKDLIFPHHENEIAQSEAATGKSFVRYWLHTGFLNVDGKKMSKSLGNYIEIPTLLKKYDKKIVRFFFISTRYSSPINFTYDGMEQAKKSLERLNDFINNLTKDNSKTLKLIQKTKKNFEEAMDENFNTPKALAVIFDFVREVNKVGGGKKVLDFMKKIDRVLGILSFEKAKISKDVEKLIRERETARKKKDFKKSDKIRDELKKKGIILEDTDKGVKWRSL